MATVQKPNLGAPENPENAVNPRWAEQFERATQNLTAIATHLQPMATATINAPADRSQWATPEEAKKYDDMVERDFVKIDPKTKKRVSENFFKLIHWFPQYQTANPQEFISFFVVDEWKFALDNNGQKIRQTVNNFNIRAREFSGEYQAVLPELVAEAEKQVE